MIRALRSSRSPERAVESLYRDYAADVYRYALAVLGSPTDAEDVTQATFLNAFRAVERGERPHHPGAWLRTIAHNLCLQQFRQNSRRPHEVQLDDDAAELVSDEDAPALEDLIRGLKQVPFNQRAALVMREFEGRSVGEIAGVLGVSIAAVETLLFRARRSLREQLEESLTCREAERAISRQLDGLLPRQERGALRAHLRQCKDCAVLARRLRAQRNSMRSLAAVPLPAALAWSHVSGGAGGATAGAAAAGVAPAGISVAAKVAAAALATGAIGGVGYLGASHQLFAPSHHTASGQSHRGAVESRAGGAAASSQAITIRHHGRFTTARPPNPGGTLAPAPSEQTPTTSTLPQPGKQPTLGSPTAPLVTEQPSHNQAKPPKQHGNSTPTQQPTTTQPTGNHHQTTTTTPQPTTKSHHYHKPKPHKQHKVQPVASPPPPPQHTKTSGGAPGKPQRSGSSTTTTTTGM